MKTNELIKLFSPSELKKFEQLVIKKHKRTSLKKLFAYVKKNKEIQKETAFQKTFNQVYSSSKDALLRNELRLLNKEIELFLVEQEWKKQLQLNTDETQLSLLKIYLERNQFTLFEQGWKKLYKKAQQERLYSLKVTLISLFFDFQLKRAEIDFDLFKEIKVLLEEALLAVVAQMQEDYKHIQLKDAFIQRNLFALSGQAYVYRPISKHYSLHTHLENDAVICYLDYCIQSYFLEGYPKIEILQKAIEHAHAVEEFSKYQTFSMTPIMSKTSIGLEYYLLKEYHKADEIYTAVLEDEHLLPAKKRPAIYFNYIANLIALGAYQKAIDWYESSDEGWKKTPHIMYRLQYILCWAYIMLQEYEKPLELLLSHNIQQRPKNDYIYARILLVIIYYSDDQIELAEREVYNLIQNSRYKSPRETFYIDYSKLLYQHIQTTYILKVDKRNKKLQQIQENLDTIYHSGANYHSTMLYQWLSDKNNSSKL